MKTETKLGKEKVIIDKDLLLEAYIILDQLYKDELKDEVNLILIKLEKATGFNYERTLKKNDNKK